MDTCDRSSQNAEALARAVDALAGAAEEAGITSEGDIADLVREARAELWVERAAARE